MKNYKLDYVKVSKDVKEILKTWDTDVESMTLRYVELERINRELKPLGWEITWDYEQEIKGLYRLEDEPTHLEIPEWVSDFSSDDTYRLTDYLVSDSPSDCVNRLTDDANQPGAVNQNSGSINNTI